MLERLLEHWLDSVNERSYQAAFCQLLAAQGYRIIHSTRHMPLEFGKDIIAIGPDGILCAFQLKGNPGSRLTLAQFREIAPQLNELVTQRIVFPGMPNSPHRSYLVTNGMIEEEVQRAIDDFNQRLVGLGFPEDQQLRVIYRGEFLNWLIRFGSSIWPIEISPMNALLETLVSEGSGLYPLSNLDKILKGILGLNETKDIRSAAALRQRIFSGAVMTAITLTAFEKKNNHYALITAWTLFAAYVHGACDRYGYSYKNGEQAVKIARGAIYFYLRNTADEIRNRIEKLQKNVSNTDRLSLFRMALIEPGGMCDFIGASARMVLVTGLLSLFWLWCEDEGWPNEGIKKAIENFFPVPMSGLNFWGEGALPQLLIHLWHWQKMNATQAPDYTIAHILGQILQQATGTKSEGMPSPYYSYEDVTRHIYRKFLSKQPDKLERESFKNSSFVAEGVLHLLVRTNLKTLCKIHWPAFTHILGNEFHPKERWQFCLLECKNGKTISTQYAPTKKWDDLKTDARSIACPAIPPTMLDDHYMLMLFAIILPHRFSPAVIRYLGYKFSDVWFLEPPIH